MSDEKTLELVKEMVKLGQLTPNEGVVEYEGKKFKITGTKRMKVKEVVEKVKKEKASFNPDRVCTKCGQPFQVSKFNPYFTECPDCRVKVKRVKEDQKKICVACGKEFTTSKFNPYLDKCPECRKPKKAKKAPAQTSEMKIPDIMQQESVEGFGPAVESQQ